MPEPTTILTGMQASAHAVLTGMISNLAAWLMIGALGIVFFIVIWNLKRR